MSTILMSDAQRMAPDAEKLVVVAAELNIPEPTLRYWVTQGWVRHWRLRGKWIYVSRGEVEAYNTFAPGPGSGPLPETPSPK